MHITGFKLCSLKMELILTLKGLRYLGWASNFGIEFKFLTSSLKEISENMNFYIRKLQMNDKK